MKTFSQAILMGLVLSIATGCLDTTLGSQTGSYKQLPKGVSISQVNTLLAEAQIVNIADGDTLTVLGPDKNTYKIRLQGIDAPKKAALWTGLQRIPDAATKPQLAEVEAYKKDRYGRIVAKVIVDGKDLALEQIKAGCGWHYLAYEKEQSARDQKVYTKAEQQARAAERGLWQDTRPVAPWDFRKQQRN